jgi:hypothetical protein
MAGTWVANEAALLPQAFNETVLAYDGNSVLITPAIQLGTIAMFRDTGSTGYGAALFKYVRYTGADQTVNGAAGEAVFSTATANVVTAQFDAGTPAVVDVAGVLHTSPSGSGTATATNQWIQVTGLAVFGTGNQTSAAAVGQALKLGGADGEMTIVAVNDLVRPAAVCVTVGASGLVLLDCVR